MDTGTAVNKNGFKKTFPDEFQSENSMIGIENGAHKNLLKSVHDDAWYFAENEFGSENSKIEIENGAHKVKSVRNTNHRNGRTPVLEIGGHTCRPP